MTRITTRLLAGAVLILAGSLCYQRLHRPAARGGADSPAAGPQIDAAFKPVATAPPSVPSLPPALSPPPRGPARVLPPPTLVYRADESFRANLDRFRDFCAHDVDDDSVLMRTDTFVGELVRRTAGERDIVMAGLRTPGAPTYYRAVLLGCLATSGDPGAEDLLWRVALDDQEDPRVSLRAVALLRAIPATTPRPRDLLQLLNREERMVRVYALQLAPAHLDDEGYGLVKTLAEAEPDINVRLAAVGAIGRAARPDGQRFLRQTIAASASGREQPFAPEALVKRAAVAVLDAADETTYALASAIARDAAEAAGVRVRAFAKCAESRPAEARTLLAELLPALPDDEVLLLKSAAEELSRLGAGTVAARARLATIGDPEIRDYLEHLLQALETAQGAKAGET